MDSHAWLVKQMAAAGPSPGLKTSLIERHLNDTGEDRLQLLARLHEEDALTTTELLQVASSLTEAKAAASAPAGSARAAVQAMRPSQAPPRTAPVQLAHHAESIPLPERQRELRRCGSCVRRCSTLHALPPPHPFALYCGRRCHLRDSPCHQVAARLRQRRWARALVAAR
jgi:hypothetical protein